MKPFQDLLQILVLVLENPDAIKNYKELEKTYRKHNMLQEAEAILRLIEGKFKNANDSNSNINMQLPTT